MMTVILAAVSCGAFLLLLWPTYREHWLTTIGLCGIALGSALNSMRLVDGMQCAPGAWSLALGGAVLAVIGERLRERKGGYVDARDLIYARRVDDGRRQ